MNSQFQSLKGEMHEMRKNYNNRGGDNASKNDDTPIYERHEASYIQFEGYQNQNSHDSYFHQSHHDPNDYEKSLTELNNDVKNDLEDLKSCIHSMRTIHDKLFDTNDQSKTDLEKLITKFLDCQRVSNMFVKNNINDIIVKMKQNEKNCQTISKNMKRKIDEWSKSQNVSSEQTDRTDPPPPPQAQTEQVNAIFTGSRKYDDSPKTQKGPPPSIIVSNKIEKDRPIKTTKKGYHVVKTKEYPFLVMKKMTNSMVGMVVILGKDEMTMVVELVGHKFLIKEAAADGRCLWTNVGFSKNPNSSNHGFGVHDGVNSSDRKVSLKEASSGYLKKGILKQWLQVSTARVDVSTGKVNIILLALSLKVSADAYDY
ncbi:hypothetical protein Tco_0019788 [Tanacetum coccineum]